MKTQRILIALTVVNLVLLVFQLAQLRQVQAIAGLNEAAAPVRNEAAGPAPVLRGSALEIVDDQGRVRASIKLHAADPSAKMPDGKTGYPETVMFRLIDSKGRPEVKMGASEQGGGVGFVGANDSTQILLKAEGDDTMLKMINKEGKQQLLKP
jgi:hypothetical protein